MSPARRTPLLVLSPTSIKIFLDCPRKFFYYRSREIPKKTDYARLCGVAVHGHIQQLYKATKEPRPFFYKTARSSMGAWFNRWQRVLAEAKKKDRLIAVDLEREEEYAKVGAACVANYWKANVDLARPLQIERRYSQIIPGVVEIVGYFDQVREVSLDWIRQHRPDLIVDGQLHEDYAPVIIVDLKTNYASYDTDRIEQGDTMQKIRRQYELHEDLQATMYTWLYYQTTGKKPVGFQWYHLRSGKTFFTFREERDFQNMHECLKHVLDNANAVSYPKHIGRSCFLCDYIVPCREDRLFYISPPEEAPDKALQLQLVPNEGVFDSGVRQGRFRLRVPREKGTPPPLAIGQHTIDVAKFPWRQEELPEEPDFEIYLN